MSYSFHHPDKWASANIDLIEETLEKEKKAVVFIAGASSSGKSYCARLLSRTLEKYSHHACIISLDSYNHGLSGIIPNKVNLHYFNGSLTHLDEIIKIIKDIIIKIPFSKKYDENTLNLIRPAIKDYFPDKDTLEKFLQALHSEWKVLNFDEPTVYDMNLAAEDVKALLRGESVEKKEYSKIVSERIPSGVTLKGKDYDVIILEGIYALNSALISMFDRDRIITNFIDGNPKTLFLRRIIRDAKATSAGSTFTTSLYFRFIIPSYISTILPSRENADVVYINDMSFLEKKYGDLYTTKMEVHTNSKEAIDHILRHSKIDRIIYERDTFFMAPNEENQSDNILRLRAYSFDEGRTYIPSSLVHKGIPKVRKDGKIIRPINVLIKEGEFGKVWKDEVSCLQDFASAGFLIGPIQKKIKWRIRYKEQMLTIRYVEGRGYFVEFDDTKDGDAVKFIRETLAKHS